MERIDVHCHAVTPNYRISAKQTGHAKPDGIPALPPWNVEGHLALMEKLNITKSILSTTSPGTHLTPNRDDDAAKITRLTNEDLSDICKGRPLKFGFFASLPLPAIQESIVEIDYALDKLGALGFALLSNANGVYLGDALLDPVFQKLNARKAIVFIHPTTCNLLTPSGQMERIKPLEQYPRPMMEFMFDETRAIANLLISGTVSKYPDITYIMSHCGCTLPPILARIGSFPMLFEGGVNQTDEFKKLLRERFYFDLAGFPFPDQIHGLLKTLGAGGEQRLFYGSDYPFTPERVVVDLAAQMDEGCKELFDEKQRSTVYSGNAKKLLGG